MIHIFLIISLCVTSYAMEQEVSLSTQYECSFIDAPRDVQRNIISLLIAKNCATKEEMGDFIQTLKLASKSVYGLISCDYVLNQQLIEFMKSTFNIDDLQATLILRTEAAAKYLKQNLPPIYSKKLNEILFNSFYNQTHFSFYDPSTIDKVYFLLMAGAQARCKSIYNDTMLEQIARNIENPLTIKIAALLLNNGVDINHQNDGGSTALMIASQYSNKEMVNLLLQNNARIDIKDKYGQTAKNYAKPFYNRRGPAIVNLFLKIEDMTNLLLKIAREQSSNQH